MKSPSDDDMGGDAYHSVAQTVELDIDCLLVGLGVIVIVLIVLFLLILPFFLSGGCFFCLVLVFFLLLFEFLAQFVVLLRQTVFVVGVLVEEHEHHIFLRAPACVAAHSVAVGAECDGITVESPSWMCVEVR